MVSWTETVTDGSSVVAVLQEKNVERRDESAYLDDVILLI